MHFSCRSGAVQSRMTSCTWKDTLLVDKNYDNGIGTKFVHLIGAGQDDLGCVFEAYLMRSVAHNSLRKEIVSESVRKIDLRIYIGKREIGCVIHSGLYIGLIVASNPDRAMFGTGLGSAT
ncbi:uncharacterized protein CLUP02_16240 [Colletotrichum lupini]|uniref:Uncharacterized protein n=1 Tax=Colletotrichum lupini TaxID=145971 RepID=A0A9Q8WPZ2_9PEZI|nr:uncharacterized protein CLUP02_16240 [Colletotrichum lupini]UQC90710.1 hypothetical protein CLUP02_16240 [Colletotrichum lupini]